MYDLLLPSLFAALLGYLGSVLNTYLTRGKNRAETESILTDIDEKNTKIQRELQDQIIGLIEQNQKLFSDMITERKTVSDEIVTINEALNVERRRNINLGDEVIKCQNASTEYVVKIIKLEQQLTKHDMDIDEIKQKTKRVPDKK